MTTTTDDGNVLRVADLGIGRLSEVLDRFGLVLRRVPDGGDIAGSYWGEPEAGVIARAIHVRDDTPVHSALHEACHVVCMSGERRDALHGAAGGDDLEESAVCYLQVLLAEHIEGVGRTRMLRDMDAWGYSFRLGSATRWFDEDAEDARDWLLRAGLITPHGQPCWACRA